MEGRGKLLPAVVVWGFVALLILPALAVSLNGITTEWNGTVLPTGPTTQWIEKLAADPRMIEAIRNSLLISTATLVISALVAIPAVLAGHFYLPLLDRCLSVLVILPYAVPGIVLALGLLRLYAGNYGVVLTGSPWILILAYVPLGASFYYVPIKNNLSAIPAREIFEAGYLVGAGDLSIMRRIILPSIAPALVVGFVMNFTLAISEFVYVNLLVGGLFPTLQIFMNVLRGGSGHLLSGVIAIYFAVILIATTIVLAATKPRSDGSS
jgi:putative spermidine/putrescine transport system permease protein